MRLFVAIKLYDDVRALFESVQAALRGGCGGVRWVRLELLHMTVKFLGEVKDDDVNGICDAVQSAAAASFGFDLTVEGCGCFPPRGGVRIVWAGLNEPTGALLSCVEGLETALAEIGFPREGRAFSPHITIGRVKFDESGGAIRRVVDRHTFPSARQSVDSLTLMSSVLSPTGPTYTSIGRFSFKP